MNPIDGVGKTPGMQPLAGPAGKEAAVVPTPAVGAAPGAPLAGTGSAESSLQALQALFNGPGLSPANRSALSDALIREGLL